MSPPFNGYLLLSEILCFTLCSKGFAAVPYIKQPLSSCEAASYSGTGAWSAWTGYSEVKHWNWVVPKSPNRNGYAGGWWRLVSLQQHMQTWHRYTHWVSLPWYWIWICLLFFVWCLSRLPCLLACVPTAVFNTWNIAALLYEFFSWQVSFAVWEMLHIYWCFSDMRSDLSNGPNWVGAFPPVCQKMETDAVIESFLLGILDRGEHRPESQWLYFVFMMLILSPLF